jgi:hypothetical protein
MPAETVADLRNDDTLTALLEIPPRTPIAPRSWRRFQN